MNQSSGESVFKALENDPIVFNSKKNTPRVPINTERSNIEPHIVKSVYESQKYTEPVVENKSQVYKKNYFHRMNNLMFFFFSCYIYLYIYHKDKFWDNQLIVI